MGFGQHQSFYLREGWLHKGLEAIKFDKSLLSRTDAFEKMGIGKNMLTALRFWLVASGVATYDIKSKTFSITEIGELIYSNDSNLNLKFSKALIHYNLSKNAEISDSNGNRSATVIYWFFNEVEGNVFEKNILLEKFSQWALQFKDVSLNSLKRDIECLIQMYDTTYKFTDPEDVLHSPLSELELLSKKDEIVKIDGTLEKVTETIIYYNLCDYMISSNIQSITLNEVVNSKLLPGRIFNLNQEELLNAIFSLKKKGLIEFIQTNNLDTIQLKNKISDCQNIIRDFYIESRDINESII